MWKHVPNIVTFIRLGLTLVFLGMILYAPRMTDRTRFLDIAFVLFVVTALTDIVDGVIARRFNAATKFGRIVDPLADKILVCGAFVCFAIVGLPQFSGCGSAAPAVIRWSVAGILILRETYVTVLRHMAEARGVNFAAVASGKIKMILQSFTIGTILAEEAHVGAAAWGQWTLIVLLAAMVAITVYSGLDATRRTKAVRI
jgi:CDP-diacylglycerol--glycerol-3-phosphate 3-phosphatidyltransferase